MFRYESSDNDSTNTHPRAGVKALQPQRGDETSTALQSVASAPVPRSTFGPVEAGLATLVIFFISMGPCMGQDAMCREQLSNYLRIIDTEFKLRPNGPGGQIRKNISQPLPIECSTELFREIVRQSPHYIGLSDQPTYLIASFRNKNLEMGVSFRKETQKIDEAYARFEKW